MAENCTESKTKAQVNSSTEKQRITTELTEDYWVRIKLLHT
jgi:hypothetical protein